MKKWNITLSFLFVVLFCANVSGATVDDNVYNALAPCYSENLIASYGPVPVFDGDNKLKSAGKSTLFTDNDTFQKEWYQKMHQLYENTKCEIDEKYSYPRGPVISYGTDALGSVIIGIYEKEETDSAFREKIYSTIKSEADLLGIDDLPVIFFIAPMPELQSSRTDNWRPIIGGIQGGSDIGPCSIGFAATRNGQNGFVTTGHIGDTGATVYQPNFKTRWAQSQSLQEGQHLIHHLSSTAMLQLKSLKVL
ncbi:S1 family peptidase [Methanomicrobium antiquum]|uniref:S1 family peptidase n=1 Tax=Methanomicrobium antiquum TaxID=487686 RepID=A0AAF0JTJ7_9EURY|nr:hypothetical protein [Methanomicrobium antiquum]MDD3977338.1 hypothetical protein [Methanomicrobium sp.]WFN36418.1 S1 family peptidase [Methanomicrobium antiquum]